MLPEPRVFEDGSLECTSSGYSDLREFGRRYRTRAVRREARSSRWRLRRACRDIRAMLRRIEAGPSRGGTEELLVLLARSFPLRDPSVRDSDKRVSRRRVR